MAYPPAAVAAKPMIAHPEETSIKAQTRDNLTMVLNMVFSVIERFLSCNN
jgi:hypothetical protein